MQRPLTQTWLVAAFGAAVCALGAHVGADARWLAAVGDAIFRTGDVPHSIPYASAPGLPWYDAPALGQLVFHALEAMLGDRGLILAQVVAVAIALSAVALDLGFAHARHGAGAAVLAACLVFNRAQRDPFGSWCVLAASTAALVATPALLHTVDYYNGVLHGEAAAGHYGLWATLSFRDPLDVLFVAVAFPLFVAALRRRPGAWEVVVLVALGVLTVDAHRNGLWLVLFAATPAARAFGPTRSRPWLSRRSALICFCVPIAMLVAGFVRPVAIDGAGEPLLRKAAAAAQGAPILAEPVAAEQLALRGDRIWIGNPIDAFAPRDQRLYLDWLRGLPAGDSLLRGP